MAERKAAEREFLGLASGHLATRRDPLGDVFPARLIDYDIVHRQVVVKIVGVVLLAQFFGFTQVLYDTIEDGIDVIARSAGGERKALRIEPGVVS